MFICISNSLAWRKGKPSPGVTPCLALLISTVVLWFTFASATASAVDLVHHDLTVNLLPDKSVIRVIDRIRLAPGGDKSVALVLGQAADVQIDGGVLTRLDRVRSSRFQEYNLTVASLPAEVEIRYSLTVSAPLPTSESAPSAGMPRAWLNDEGVFLDGGSAWYPWLGAAPFTFKLRVSAPAGWEIISQDRRLVDKGDFVWQTEQPQQEIYLLGGPYQRYAKRYDDTELAVYLLQEDAAVADRYLRIMGQYIDFYSDLLGGYPYAGFGVVENRWQTGYGMPSFTLLGSRVLRLPFILHSSLPHEILHNWWGNGVYIDQSSGNWSEGLTAYLADHLIKEAQGQGAGYRRKALERYANYAAEGRDLPLRAFKSRHNDASQAVGYGKTLMLFHMLRRELGDDAFVMGLRRFWQQHRFREAGFDELRATLQQAVGANKPLASLDDDWLSRTGAPIIELGDVQLTARKEGGFRLQLTLLQTQSEAPFSVVLPISVAEMGRPPVSFEVPLKQRKTLWTQEFATQPARVDIDPHYDVFRLLGADERPASLSRLFGAPRQLLVLPADASGAMRDAWRDLAQAWSKRYGNLELVTDSDLGVLPDDTAVWLLGWDNTWLETSRSRFEGSGQGFNGRHFAIEGQTVADDAVVVALDPENRRPPLGFIGAQHPAEVRALARKLPHYGTFGRLLFKAHSVENTRRDTLAVAGSALSRLFAAEDPGPPREVVRPLGLQARQSLQFD